MPFNNVTDYNIGGRLIPRSLVETNVTALMKAFKYIVADNPDGGISVVSVNVSSYPLNVRNSVNPVWRTSIFSVVIGLYVRRFYTSLDSLQPRKGFVRVIRLSILGSLSSVIQLPPSPTTLA